MNSVVFTTSPPSNLFHWYHLVTDPSFALLDMFKMYCRLNNSFFSMSPPSERSSLASWLRMAIVLLTFLLVRRVVDHRRPFLGSDTETSRLAARSPTGIRCCCKDRLMLRPNRTLLASERIESIIGTPFSLFDREWNASTCMKERNGPNDIGSVEVEVRAANEIVAEQMNFDQPGNRTS